MRALLVLPLLLLAFALLAPGAALAAGEGTSGYSSKPEEPKTGSKPEEPKTGTSPEKEEKSTPAAKEEPSKETSPSKEAKASTLPFTGFDLRWSIAAGVLLMGAGFGIVVVQRRQRDPS